LSDLGQAAKPDAIEKGFGSLRAVVLRVLRLVAVRRAEPPVVVVVQHGVQRGSPSAHASLLAGTPLPTGP